ncbi:MAG: dTMP kinase [Polyangiaceae bacterium]|nr:dTMP kinase [Polyangiaceae bacterium]MCW5790639.1 dTMP kinase [Polyangiaceae bacterium]
MSAGVGRFIVLEGIDGSGSTTQTRRLAASLGEAGHAVLTTCQPSSGPVGTLIRSVLRGELLGPASSAGAGAPRPFQWSTLALLFAADRLDHLTNEVEPALRAGQVVLCDRYDLSSLTYQSLTAPDRASGSVSRADETVQWIRALNREARRPDLTLVLDVSAEVAEARRQARGGAEELYERRELQARLAERYLQAEALVPGDPLVHIAADAEEQVVARAVREAVRDALGI